MEAVLLSTKSFIIGSAGKGVLHLQATRDQERTYAFVYFPLNDQSTTINSPKLNASRISAWWYDPRTGVGKLMGKSAGGNPREFRSPPQGPDWVLVLDDVTKKYPLPGLEPISH